MLALWCAFVPFRSGGAGLCTVWAGRLGVRVQGVVRVTDRERWAAVVGAVVRVLRRQATVSADDLHAELGTVEFPGDRRIFGAVLKGLATAGRLAPVGYKTSRRAACHGRPILTFREVAR